MKILLDSTYLFPALNIDILEGWSKADLKRLILNEDHFCFFCDLSLFEMYTKCLKLILQGKLTMEIEAIQKGIQSILNSPKIHKINWWEHVHEAEMMLKLKKTHNDSIDCMLFYLAVVNCDAYATFDETMVKNFSKDEGIKQFIQDVNPQFKIWLNELNKPPLLYLK